MIDAHTHLHDHQYDADRTEVIARIFAQNIDAIINIGTSIDESRDAVALAQSNRRMYATVGIHPHTFNNRAIIDDDMEQLRALAQKTDKVVAIGEVGLDYFSREQLISNKQKQVQRDAFIAQIELARREKLPVVVHCRDAYDDCYEIIARNDDVRFVMHCYMASEQDTQKFLTLPHVWFSFAGNVTYSKTPDSEMNRVIRMIPLEQMMVETDAPYLSPVPYRGMRNESTYMVHTAQYIANLKEVGLDDIDRVTTQTTKNFFHLMT